MGPESGVLEGFFAEPEEAEGPTSAQETSLAPIGDDFEPTPKQLERASMVADRIRESEDRILEKSAWTIDAALDFATAMVHAQPPPEWVEAFGREKAEERLRIAQAALSSPSKVPFGLVLAQKAHAAITKARSGERDYDQPIGVTIVRFDQVEIPKFPEVVETEGEDT